MPAALERDALLPRSDAAQALLVAERLRSMVEALEIHADEDLVLHITASFGVATLSPAISTVDAHSPLMGHPGAIVLDADGTMRGAHDPRSDGYAIGCP